MNIDFISGTHGNYLEFVLNKLLLGESLGQSLPFDAYGSSHVKTDDYQAHQIVRCGHFFNSTSSYTSNQIISIRFTKADMLPILSNHYHRSFRPSLKDQDLHVNTYHKVRPTPHRVIIDLLAENYNVVIDSNNPNCPRHILRHLYQWMFLPGSPDPWTSVLNQIQYDQTKTVYFFTYTNFYDTEKFLDELESIKNFFGLTFVDYNTANLHKEFLSKTPFRNYKQTCDAIVTNVLDKKSMDIPQLTLFQECYINAQLESNLGVKIFMPQDEYFLNTKDLAAYIEEIGHDQS